MTDYLCGGELFTHLHQIGPFSESGSRVYGAEITLALEHLHSVSPPPYLCDMIYLSLNSLIFCIEILNWRIFCLIETDILFSLTLDSQKQ